MGNNFGDKVGNKTGDEVGDKVEDKVGDTAGEKWETLWRDKAGRQGGTKRHTRFQGGDTQCEITLGDKLGEGGNKAADKVNSKVLHGRHNGD